MKTVSPGMQFLWLELIMNSTYDKTNGIQTHDHDTQIQGTSI